MGRAGKHKARDTGPTRKCCVSGEVLAKRDLIRFVLGPNGTLVPDIHAKLPGRGIYVAANRALIDQAIAKNAFARSAKCSVTIPDGLLNEVEQQLSRRVTNLISLARKSGDAIAGYEKVKGWLDREHANVLIQASDGSERGKSKLSTPHFGSFIGWLTADELGLAFGRQTVIHAALASGGLSNRVVEEARRLKGVRLGKGGETRRERT